MPTSAELIAAHVRWLRSRHAANTASDAEKLLTRVDAELPYGLPVALFEELEAWLSRPGWSAQTRETYRGHIVRFFAWACRPQAKRVSYNPAAALEPFHVPRGLPRPATDAQVEWCVTEAVMPWRAICTLTAFAGARPCEVARIAQDPHRYVTAETVTIVQGKGGKSRVVKTHAMLWALVGALPSGPLATRRNGDPIDARWVSNCTNQYLHRADRGHTLYQLRHWFGTTMQARHRDLRATQEAMGHASPATTQVYTLVTAEAIAAAVDSLPSFTRR